MCPQIESTSKIFSEFWSTSISVSLVQKFFLSMDNISHLSHSQIMKLLHLIIIWFFGLQGWNLRCGWKDIQGRNVTFSFRHRKQVCIYWVCKRDSKSSSRYVTFLQTHRFLSEIFFDSLLFSLMAGKYYYLPNASDSVISATTKEALSALKSSWLLE